MTREQDRQVFHQAQALFWMLCATDGHAKNFSFFIRPGGRYQLTPLYDVLSAYPVLSSSTPNSVFRCFPCVSLNDINELEAWRRIFVVVRLANMSVGMF